MTTAQGLLPVAIEVVDDDATLTAHAGLPLVLETMRALGVSEVLDGALGIRQRNHGATDAEKVEALVLRMAAGGESVDDIEVLRADKWLALPPSMETARPKRMRFSLFSIAGRIVSHAGKIVLRIGREAEALASLIAARIKIAQVGLARIAAASA